MGWDNFTTDYIGEDSQKKKKTNFLDQGIVRKLESFYDCLKEDPFMPCGHS